MSERHTYLKHLVFSEMQRARIDGRHGDPITLVLDTPASPKLREQRTLAGRNEMAAEGDVPHPAATAVTFARPKHSAAWISSLYDDDPIGRIDELPCSVEERPRSTAETC